MSDSLIVQNREVCSKDSKFNKTNAEAIDVNLQPLQAQRFQVILGINV